MFKKVVKIIIPKYIFNKKFDALMYSFKIAEKYNNEITFKKFEINNSQYITFIDYDDKNLKIDKYKNGVCVFYYNKLPTEIPPIIK